MDSIFHRIWECPCNADIEEARITKDWVPEAATEALRTPCLWLRGVPPADVVSDLPVPEGWARSWGHLGAGPLRGVPSAPLLAFGDASGGEHTSDPRLRRVGWCWVTVSWDTTGMEDAWHAGLAGTSLSTAPGDAWECVAGCSGALGGPHQSVNRGELMAFLSCVKATRGDLVFVIDSKYVSSGWRKRVLGRLVSTHCDLWSELAAGTADRNVQVVRIPSHLGVEEFLTTGWDPRLWVGNELADQGAESAAAESQLPFKLVERVLHLDAACFQTLSFDRFCDELQHRVTGDQLQERPGPVRHNIVQ